MKISVTEYGNRELTRDTDSCINKVEAVKGMDEAVVVATVTDGSVIWVMNASRTSPVKF